MLSGNKEDIPSLSMLDDPRIKRVPNPLIGVLLQTKVEDIRPPTTVRYLHNTDTVQTLIDALRLPPLVTSFPVLDADAEDGDECLGVVDGVDLLSFLHHASTVSATKGGGQNGRTSEDLRDILSMPVEYLINCSQSNPYMPIASTTSLHGAITILAPGCRRALVFRGDDSARLHSIFSQSDLIRFLFKLLRISRETAMNPTTSHLVHPTITDLADTPIRRFSSIKSRPSRYVFEDSPLADAVTHVLQLRGLSTPSSSSSSNTTHVAGKGTGGTNSSGGSTSGPSTSSATPLVLVLRRDGSMVGYLSPEDLKHTSGNEVVKLLSMVGKCGDREREREREDVKSEKGERQEGAEGEEGTRVNPREETMTDVDDNNSITNNKTDNNNNSNNDNIDGVTIVERTQRLLRSLTVKQYLQRFSPQALQPIIVSSSIPLRLILEVVAVKHAHHIWVLDDKRNIPIATSTTAQSSSSSPTTTTTTTPTTTTLSSPPSLSSFPLYPNGLSDEAKSYIISTPTPAPDTTATSNSNPSTIYPTSSLSTSTSSSSFTSSLTSSTSSSTSPPSSPPISSSSSSSSTSSSVDMSRLYLLTLTDILRWVARDHVLLDNEAG